MNRLYIAGPMTGYPSCNLDAFNTAEKYWRMQDFDVCNPATKQGEDLEGMTGHEPLLPDDLKKIVKQDLEMLQSCTHIYMLRGWEKSVGARAEHAVAVWLGLHITYQA